jgi:hypothetical protein
VIADRQAQHATWCAASVYGAAKSLILAIPAATLPRGSVSPHAADDAELLHRNFAQLLPLYIEGWTTGDYTAGSLGVNGGCMEPARCSMPTGFRAPCRKSLPVTIGPISFGVRQVGERSARDMHATFDKEGVGNVVWLRGCDGHRHGLHPTLLACSATCSRATVVSPIV